MRRPRWLGWAWLMSTAAVGSMLALIVRLLGGWRLPHLSELAHAHPKALLAVPVALAAGAILFAFMLALPWMRVQESAPDGRQP